jgi:hypothetical protein
VPSENRFWADDSDSSKERGEQVGHGRDGQPITGLEPRARGGPLEDDELLADKGILGEESGAGGEHAHEGPGQTARQFANHRDKVSADFGPQASDRPVGASESLASALVD